jgi:ATP-binding cassette subfamily E protein 1
VRALLHKKIRDAYMHPQFVSDVMKPMTMEPLMDQEVQNLSGGELQRVAIALCLGQPADIYLIDEPSAYLDSEQRIMTAKVGRRLAAAGGGGWRRLAAAAGGWIWGPALR